MTWPSVGLRNSRGVGSKTSGGNSVGVISSRNEGLVCLGPHISRNLPYNPTWTRHRADRGHGWRAPRGTRHRVLCTHWRPDASPGAPPRGHAGVRRVAGRLVPLPQARAPFATHAASVEGVDLSIVGTARRVGKRYAPVCRRHARLCGCLPHFHNAVRRGDGGSSRRSTMRRGRIPRIWGSRRRRCRERVRERALDLVETCI